MYDYETTGDVANIELHQSTGDEARKTHHSVQGKHNDDFVEEVVKLYRIVGERFVKAARNQA